MSGMDDDDRFGWISDRCRISASQEEFLINAPFVVPNCSVVGADADVDERVSSEEDEDESRDVETVVMVSVSESSEEGSGEEEEDEYKTPPERHSHSLTSSNEARIGAGEDGVDCVVQESLEKTVDLGRDCEADGGVEFRVEKLSVCEDGLVEKGECFPNTVLASVSVDLDDSDSETVNLGESIADGVDGCRVDANVTSTVEGSKYCAEENVFMEDDEEANAEITRTLRNTEVEAGTCSRDEGEGVNELKRKGKNPVNEGKRVRRTATVACVSGHSSLEFRILPSSFCNSDKGDGGVGLGQRTGKPGTHRENGSAGASEGDNEPQTSDAHGRTGTKASEPNEEELTNNLLKILSFLAQPLKPVYKEKVDIIGAAIKAGITFPRPSWWPEVSDDDSE